MGRYSILRAIGITLMILLWHCSHSCHSSNAVRKYKKKLIYTHCNPMEYMRYFKLKSDTLNFLTQFHLLPFSC